MPNTRYKNERIIMWDLFHNGPSKFGEIQKRTGMYPTTLSSRLCNLVFRGNLEHRSEDYSLRQIDGERASEEASQIGMAPLSLQDFKQALSGNTPEVRKMKQQIRKHLADWNRNHTEARIPRPPKDVGEFLDRHFENLQPYLIIEKYVKDYSWLLDIHARLALKIAQDLDSQTICPDCLKNGCYEILRTDWQRDESVCPKCGLVMSMVRQLYGLIDGSGITLSATGKKISRVKYKKPLGGRELEPEELKCIFGMSRPKKGGKR